MGKRSEYSRPNVHIIMPRTNHDWPATPFSSCESTPAAKSAIEDLPERLVDLQKTGIVKRIAAALLCLALLALIHSCGRSATKADSPPATEVPTVAVSKVTYQDLSRN